MTGLLEPNEELILKNLHKVIEFSKRAGVLSVLFTSKGEPLLHKSLSFLSSIIDDFTDFPLEIQTNGLLLNNETIDILDNAGLNVIAISIDDKYQLQELSPQIKIINDKGIIVRLCVNISKELEGLTFNDIMNYCQKSNVRQLTFRKLTIPEDCNSTPQAKWIKENAPASLYEGFIQHFNECEKRFIRKTVDNTDIYDCNGISIIYSDYCLQESSTSEDVRSLIFAEDGHLYTSWNSPASILF